MRRRLPCGGGIALEVGFAEAGDALVFPGRVKRRHVERKRLADPSAEFGVIGEIVVGQRMDESAEA